MTVFFCRSLQTSIVLKQEDKKKNIQVHISGAATFSGKSHPIIWEGEMTWCSTGPSLTSTIWLWLDSLLGQFLDDDSGHRVPASGCITSGVVSAGPHPHGHVHQSGFHALAQALHCKGGKKVETAGWTWTHLSLTPDTGWKLPRKKKKKKKPNCKIGT